MKVFNSITLGAGPTLALCALVLVMSACDGQDGKDGQDGRDGAPGSSAPGADPIQSAIGKGQIESCATCHGNAGDRHQARYDNYIDPSTLELRLLSVSSVPSGGDFTVTLRFRITKNGQPFVDSAGLPSLDQKRFYMVRYEAATDQYLQGNSRLRESNAVPTTTPGEYLLSQPGMPFAPESSDAQVYGYIASGALFEHAGPTSEFQDGTHVHLYDNVSNDALAFGAAADTNVNAYSSSANVTGCESCHGAPYYKHGYRAAQVAGLPDFAACKSCHFDDRNGRHTDWQYMVDDPLAWANGVAETADYSYKATLMNVTHMAHAMEFPFPQSMANCATCHADKLDQVLADENFTAETCKSCHPVQGIGAWPELGDQAEGPYYQAHRAPALQYLWTRAGVESVHSIEADCRTCHSATTPVPRLRELHSGFDKRIADASGQRYDEIYTVSIDEVSRSGNLLTIAFSASDPDIAPELLVSFYGWDTKHFLVPSHTRDSNPACQSRGRPGCRMEYEPGDDNPLFTENAGSTAGAWSVTLDMAAFQAIETDDIPTLIANGDVSRAEITITPQLTLNGVRLGLDAVTQTFDFNDNLAVDDYFKGDNKVVDTDKCDSCHGQLAVSFHSGSGRGGDIVACKNCHAPVYPGSHIEMASRSIENYVHAIHSFQPFDLDDVAAANDPVSSARNAQHQQHTFPNFTIRNCEACHAPGTYNVPDQAQSIPGVLSAAYDIADRNIGSVPEAVTGPASRACGGCHRADIINADLAGELASFNAKMGTFGTYVDNDPADETLFGIIDRIMTQFE